MTNYLVNIFIAFLKVGRPLLKGRLQIQYSFFLTLTVAFGSDMGSMSGPLQHDLVARLV